MRVLQEFPSFAELRFMSAQKNNSTTSNSTPTSGSGRTPRSSRQGESSQPIDISESPAGPAAHSSGGQRPSFSTQQKGNKSSKAPREEITAAVPKESEHVRAYRTKLVDDAYAMLRAELREMLLKKGKKILAEKAGE